GEKGNSTPFIPAPLEPARTQLAAFDTQVTAAEERVKEAEPKLAAGQQTWERKLGQQLPPTTLNQGLIAHFTFHGHATDVATPARGGKFDSYSPGILGQAAELDGKRVIELGDICKFERDQPFSYGAWIFTRDGTDGAFIGRIDEGKGTQ